MDRNELFCGSGITSIDILIFTFMISVNNTINRSHRKSRRLPHIISIAGAWCHLPSWPQRAACRLPPQGTAAHSGRLREGRALLTTAAGERPRAGREELGAGGCRERPRAGRRLGRRLKQPTMIERVIGYTYQIYAESKLTKLLLIKIKHPLLKSTVQKI